MRSLFAGRCIPFIILLLLLVGTYSAELYSQTALAIGTVTASDGEDVVVPITIENLENSGGFQLDIRYDQNDAVFDFTPGGPHAVLGVVSKHPELSAQPDFYFAVSNPATGIIRLYWEADLNTSLNIATGVLFELAFTFTSVASTPLDFIETSPQAAGSVVIDPLGQRIPVTYSGGMIKIETNDIPSQTVLSSPADNGSSVAMPVALQWEDAAGADFYKLEVSSDESFLSSVLSADELYDNSFIAAGLDGLQEYFWRVKGVNDNGESSWSIPFSFRTALGIPAVPAVVEPQNGAEGLPLNVTFSWHSVPHAEKYGLQLSANASMTSLLLSVENYTDTTYTSDKLSPNVMYYWRVYAVNQAGQSEYSDIYKFTTLITPPGIVLINPEDGANSQPTTIHFSWKLPDDLDAQFRATILGYQFELTPDTTQLFYIEDVDDTTTSVSGIPANSTFYWRVAAVNDAGTGEFSPWFSFTTGQATGNPPALKSPADGAMDVPLEVLLEWYAGNNATGYRVQVSAVSDFSTTLLDSSLSETSVTIVLPERSTTYYWRAATLNGSIESPFSAVREFTTVGIEELAAPTGLIALAENVGQVELTWTDNAEGEAAYVILRKDGPASSTAGFTAIDTIAADSQFYVDTVEDDELVFTYMVYCYTEGVSSDFSNEAEVTTISGIEELSGVPHSFYLGQNFPNPFNPETTIRFGLKSPAKVRLAVYDIQGRELALLADGAFSTGHHEIIWNAQTQASGIYLYRIFIQPETGVAISLTEKMILLR